MRVFPYRSIDHADPQVYHVDDACPDGMRILEANRRYGAGDVPICRGCQVL